MKKIRFAVIGTGRITRWVLQGAQEDARFCLAAVCSRDGQRAADFIKDYPAWPGARVFTSVEELATADDIVPYISARPMRRIMPMRRPCWREGSMSCARSHSSPTPPMPGNWQPSPGAKNAS